MAEDDNVKYPLTLWRNGKGKELVIGRTSRKLIQCWTCACCHPRVIARHITNASSEETKTWWLTAYQGEHVGFPGGRWRIRDVGEAHYRDPSAGCSGSIYNNGRIDSKGKLVGLPEKFVSGYRYNGYMELQQGCVMPDGSVKWPCPNG